MFTRNFESIVKSTGKKPTDAKSTGKGNTQAIDSTNSPTPWFFTFESQKENAGVIPSGMKFFPKGPKSSCDGWEVLIDGTWRGFPSKEDAYTAVGIKKVKCPLSNHMVPEGDVGAICRYLARYHPDEWTRLKGICNGRVKTLYVYTDCYSPTRRYKHDKLPGVSFATKSDLDKALGRTTKGKVPIETTSPEKPCRNGNGCRGKDGGCGFNHEGQKMCRHEKSSSGCTNLRCSFNHNEDHIKKTIVQQTISTSVTPTKVTPVSKPSHVSKPPLAPAKIPGNTFDILNDDADEDDVSKDLSSQFEEAQDTVVVTPVVATSESGDSDGFQEVKSKHAKKTHLLATKKPEIVKEPIKKAVKKPTKIAEEPIEEPVKEPIEEPVKVTPSWKDTCLAGKVKREAEKLAKEAEEQRLKDEAEAEEQRLKDEVAAEKQQKLKAQFEGLVLLPGKPSEQDDEPKKSSKKSSKKGSNRGIKIDAGLFFA